MLLPRLQRQPNERRKLTFSLDEKTGGPSAAQRAYCKGAGQGILLMTKSRTDHPAGRLGRPASSLCLG